MSPRSRVPGNPLVIHPLIKIGGMHQVTCRLVGIGQGDVAFGLRLNNAPMDLAASYKVTTNDFLANGGDGFTNLKVGTGVCLIPQRDPIVTAKMVSSIWSTGSRMMAR